MDRIAEIWSRMRTRADPEIETLAMELYEKWRDQEGWRPWVRGGNSFKQDAARQTVAQHLCDMAQGDR